MNKNITLSDGTKIWLPEEVYKLKPAKEKNFAESTQITDVFKEPSNFIEELQQLINNVERRIKELV